MSSNILSALRACGQLKGNLKFTAQEIGHRMNAQGYGRVAYQMMSAATGYSRRTVINHMHQLVAKGIFAKTVYRLKFGNAINLYKCLLPIRALARPHAKGANAASRLPTDRRGEAKELSLREEIARQRQGMRFWSEGSLQWTRSVEEIARLEALLRR